MSKRMKERESRKLMIFLKIYESFSSLLIFFFLQLHSVDDSHTNFQKYSKSLVENLFQGK